MLNSTQLKDSAGLLVEVPELQQERITGGAANHPDYFFYQQTDIQSSASDDSQIQDSRRRKKRKGNLSGSSSSNSDYTFSQTTLAFGNYQEDDSSWDLGGFIGGILGIFGF